MVEANKQDSKLNRRSSSLRDNLLRRKKAVKSREAHGKQNSLSENDTSKENDSISS